MVRFLADTNVVGHLVRNHSPALTRRLHAAMQAGEVAISVATRAETRFGQALMTREDKRHIIIDLLLQELPTLDWSRAAADQYGKLAGHLHSKGQPIGVMDTMIAAHALAEGLTLVTNNTRDFKRVPRLEIVDWTL